MLDDERVGQCSTLASKILQQKRNLSRGGTHSEMILRGIQRFIEGVEGRGHVNYDRPAMCFVVQIRKCSDRIDSIHAPLAVRVAMLCAETGSTMYGRLPAYILAPPEHETRSVQDRRNDEGHGYDWSPKEVPMAMMEQRYVFQNAQWK